MTKQELQMDLQLEETPRESLIKFLATNEKAKKNREAIRLLELSNSCSPSEQKQMRMQAALIIKKYNL